MSKLLESLAVLAEVTGMEWSKPTIQFIERELLLYPEAGAMEGMRRCMTEVRGKVTLADIVQRIPGNHPGAEEAWAIVSPKVRSDDPTVFVTDPMREAYGAALEAAGDRLDMVAARMAFKEVYMNAVGREGNTPVTWSIIPGTNRAMKELAITEAAKKGLVGIEWAMKQLPVEAHPSLVQFAGDLNLKRIA